MSEEVTFEDVLEIALRWHDQYRPVELHLGVMVWVLTSAFFEAPRMKMYGGVLGQTFGVTVVVKRDLPNYAWRLVARDGKIINEGELHE